MINAECKTFIENCNYNITKITIEEEEGNIENPYNLANLLKNKEKCKTFYNYVVQKGDNTNKNNEWIKNRISFISCKKMTLKDLIDNNFEKKMGGNSRTPQRYTMKDIAYDIENQYLKLVLPKMETLIYT